MTYIVFNFPLSGLKQGKIIFRGRCIEKTVFRTKGSPASNKNVIF